MITVTVTTTVTITITIYITITRLAWQNVAHSCFDVEQQKSLRNVADLTCSTLNDKRAYT